MDRQMTQPEMPRDWDDAYANGIYVPGAEALPKLWAHQAAEYRESGIDVAEYSYGDHHREKYDLVLPDGPPKGLCVFVHGGYWMQFDKSSWTDLAEGARANGWAVCLPSYTLVPDVRLSEITRQIGAAINDAATKVSGPIRLAGHSAGGHLVARMICDDAPLSRTVSARIEHVLAISGLHDLRPLLQTRLNERLRLDLAEAKSESPVFHSPKTNTHLTAWVGGDERPEFIRQSQLIANIWRGFDTHVNCEMDSDHNHFSVIADLQLPDSPITRAFVGDS